MSLNHRQQHQLYRIESSLLRSDPKLAARLATFARLGAGQHMPAWEHIATRPDRIRQAWALILQAIAAMVAAISLLASAVLALLAAIIVGRRARPLRSAHQPPGHGIDGRPDRPAGADR